MIIFNNYPYLKNWYKIYFGNKIYFSYKTQNNLKLIYKINICYCQNYIKKF